jgi:hypothetical protein
MQFDTHWDIVGRHLQKLEELHFRIFQRRIRHIVHERDSDAIRARKAAFNRI